MMLLDKYVVHVRIDLDSQGGIQLENQIDDAK